MISVITVTYRDPPGLSRTLRSLVPLADHLDASGIGWEHVVVDSSPEENAPILGELPAAWPLKHRPTPPHGIFAAMNVGVRESTEPYLWFLNGGDEAGDIAELTAIVGRLRGEPRAELLVCGGIETADGRDLYRFFPPPNLRQALLGVNRMFQQGLFYRRGVFDRVGLFDDRYAVAADYQHLLRALAAGVTTEHVRRVAVRREPNGTSERQWILGMREVFAAMLDVSSLPRGYVARSLVWHGLWWVRRLTARGLRRTPAGVLVMFLSIWWKRRLDHLSNRHYA